MYRLFSASVKNYFEMNPGQETERLRIAGPLRLLADLEQYQEEARKGTDVYILAALLLRVLDQYRETDGVMGTLARDLYGMGFDLTGLASIPPERITQVGSASELDEQLRLIRLFSAIGAYWPKAPAENLCPF